MSPTSTNQNRHQRVPHYQTPTKASRLKSTGVEQLSHNSSSSPSPIKIRPRRQITQTKDQMPSASSTDYNHHTRCHEAKTTTAAVTPRYMTPTKSCPTRGISTPQPQQGPPKRLYLIRHGESMGQAARRLGMNRRTDLRLVDAALTQRGMAQAEQLLYNEEMQEQVELVVSSPLTRALHTAVLGFAEKPILIHYDLAELGCRVPENTPRKMKLVLNDVDDARHEIDSTTLQPSHWPHTFDRKPRAIRTAMEYLYSDRQETCIAVVCHYNIIRALLSPASVQPDNADPIRCLLHWDSTVTLDGEANEGANLDSEQVNNDSQIDEIDL